MKANLENISNRIQQKTEQVCREAVVNWKKSVQAGVQPFHDIFQGFLDQFDTVEIDSSYLLKIWQTETGHECDLYGAWRRSERRWVCVQVLIAIQIYMEKFFFRDQPIIKNMFPIYLIILFQIFFNCFYLIPP